MRKNANNYMSNIAKVLLLIAALSFFVLFIARRNSEFAEWVSANIGYYVRMALAKMSSVVPFSIGEVLICLSPVIIIAVIIVGARKSDGKSRIRFLSGVLAVLSLFYTGYVYTLGVGYNRMRIQERLNIESVEITGENLYSTALLLKEECEALLDEIDFSESGSSVSDIDFSDMSDEALIGYEALEKDFPTLDIKSFDSAAKPVHFSKVMTWLDLLGVYTYFTGESNVNVHYPDYTIPHTVAHEMAHQRGIAREDEANFVAFLVCARADSAYVRYSGYLNMLEYVASALYKTDKKLYRELVLSYDSRIKGEINALNEFYHANRNETLGKLSDTVNDNYLKAQGTEGVVSYGLVVKLCVAYYSNK